MRKTSVFFKWVPLAAACLVLTAVSALAMPNPPALLNTTWSGPFEVVVNTRTTATKASGTISLSIDWVSGNLFRGTETTSPPFGDGTPKPIAGMVYDGELIMVKKDRAAKAMLFYDNTGTPAWKIRGYWQATVLDDPKSPAVGWFLLKKQ